MGSQKEEMSLGMRLLESDGDAEQVPLWVQTVKNPPHTESCNWSLVIMLTRSKSSAEKNHNETGNKILTPGTSLVRLGLSFVSSI